ncbi:hypothetical protein GW17_00043302 [Ensete ventricosum]|nr:hypothetical protein GW17_00043302 [Ensete ventricosum]
MLRTTKEVEEEKKKILTLAMASGVEHGANKMALTATKLLLGEVFLGWLMIWGMLPTHTYRERWLPMLLSKMKTTYFGRLVTGYKRTDPVSHCRYHFINLITTFSRIRHRMFELFFYSHQLYILFLIFYLLHVGISFFYLVLPGVYLFMVDRFLRFLQSRNKVRLVSARLLPSETVELNFSMDPSKDSTTYLLVRYCTNFGICSQFQSDLVLKPTVLPQVTVADLSRLWLRIEAFVTGERVPPSEPNKLIRTAWFNPDPSDLPLAPVLLRRRPLACCVVTRYYIYPIENGTNGFSSSSCKSLLNLLFIWIGIVVTSTAAVLWNKKSSTMKAKIQNTEALTDRELESVPHQFIVGATTVHFRERPDFKSKGHLEAAILTFHASVKCAVS